MGTEQSMTTASRIEEVVERLREEAEAFGGSQFPDDDGNVLAALFTEAADLLLHLKPVLEENERLQRDRERYQWLADEVLACDFGDNDSGQIGWRIRADVRVRSKHQCRNRQCDSD